MATIATVSTKGGAKRYQVRWWERPGQQRKRTFSRFEDARRFKTQTERQLDTGDYINPSRGRITLGEWYVEYMATAQLAPKTRDLYETEARLYVLPALGDHVLSSITRANVEDLFADMRARGKGDATIAVTHRLLGCLMSKAVRDERIGRNPAASVSVAKGSKREPRFLNAAEVAVLADAVPARERALVLLLSYCGPRIGEASYLRVKHVDLFRRRVIIEGSAGEVRGRWVEGPTKSGKKRAVALPAFLVDELMTHRSRYTDESDPDAYFFPGENGGPLRANNWRKRVLYPACERVGIVPTPHVHDLRHSAASLAIQAGAHPKAVQEMLGHASIVMTLDLYSHLFESLQDEMAERLDSIYREVALPGSRNGG
jgi:integrase